MSKRRRPLPRGLYWRGDTIYALAQVGGQRIRKCLFTDDVGVARSRREKLISDLRFGGTDTVTWEEAVIAWAPHIKGTVGPKTARRYAVSIQQLIRWLSGRKLSEINKALVGKIVDDRRASGVTTATIRRDLTALSSVLQYAEARGWHEGNAALAWFRLTKERRDPFRMPERWEIETVINHAGGMEALIRIAMATGARQDELVRAERRDLDADRKALTLYGKGNKVRTIDVSECWHLFASLPLGIEGAALIPCPSTGGRWKNVASRFALITKRAEEAAKAEGRPFRRFRFHDLRHLHAVEWMRAGRSIYGLMQRLGHSSVKTTEIYLKHGTSAETSEKANVR